MWYTGENEKSCVREFLESLATINAAIIKKNKNLDVPYKYLLPIDVQTVLLINLQLYGSV